MGAYYLAKKKKTQCFQLESIIMEQSFSVVVVGYYGLCTEEVHNPGQAVGRNPSKLGFPRKTEFMNKPEMCPNNAGKMQ